MKDRSFFPDCEKSFAQLQIFVGVIYKKLSTVEPGYIEIGRTAKNCSLYPDLVIAEISKVKKMIEVQYYHI